MSPAASHPLPKTRLPRPRPARPWSVTAIGGLLLVEMAGLLFLAFTNIRRPVGPAFAALALLALTAAIGFARLRRGGWVNAVLAQGGELLLALLIFFGARPVYAYLMMVYGILMVLYLHQDDVQAVFRLAPGPGARAALMDTVRQAPPVSVQAPAEQTAREADSALLRRFEPVMRFNRGERFFPVAVDRYVRESSLWEQRPGEEAVLMVPEGELTVEKLAEPRPAEFGTVYFLKFIEPLNIAELAAYTLQHGLAKKDPNDIFHAGRGRLARVGYGSRFVAALFSITLLARGRVPGDTAAAAVQVFDQMMADDPRHRYYGRVLRQDGWIALQYWFFYAFNSWRSGFFGVNDHEADWEMIYVYLPEAGDGSVTPEWAAYANHDFAGDDLRRRWDDPELEKVGEHPVIYAGAGSHSSYYEPGEYLAELELPFLSPLVRLVDAIDAVWRRIIGETQGPGHHDRGPTFNIFRIPFVDYARGDGHSIGAGAEWQWAEPVLLDETQAWAQEYRGLWGLYVHDPIAGENAPAGPVYNPDGRMRRSWYDPLGWAGLDKVPPPDQTPARIVEQREAVLARRAALELTIETKSRELTSLGLEAAAMVGLTYLAREHAAHQAKITALARELDQLRAQVAGDDALAEALALHAADWQAGQRGEARAHIHRAAHPAPASDLRMNRVAEFWAAISIGLVMVGFVALVLFARPFLLVGLIALLSVIIFVEASFRRQLERLVDSGTIALTVVAVLVLVFQFFWQIVVVAVLVAGGYIMWENLHELRR